MSTDERLLDLALRHYGPSPGSHAHGHYQVLWGWRGALALEIEGRGAQVDAGRVAIIAPGQRHDFHAAGAGSDCFVLDVCSSSLEPFAGRVMHSAPQLQLLLRFLSLRAGALPPAAAELLLASLQDASPAMQQRMRRRIDWQRLDAWIDAHLAEPIGVARLAQQVHLSPTQFAARCLEEAGATPMAYLRERRLASARVLRAQGLSVSETALRCGYASPSALTAALRRH